MAMLSVMQPWRLLAFFAIKGVLLVHDQLVVHLDPRILSCKADFQLVSPQHLLVHGVIPSQRAEFGIIHC